MSETSERYYIATGRTGAMFTLRCEYSEPRYRRTDRGAVLDGIDTRDQHIATLSTDLETAIAKATQRLGFAPEVAETTVREITNRDSDAVREAARSFQGGKYEGKTVTEVADADLRYCVWFARNRGSKARDKHTVAHLLAIPAVAEAVAAEEAVEADRTASIADRYLARLAELEETTGGHLDTAPGERFDTEATLEVEASFDGQYGTGWIYKLRTDDGALLVWFASRRQGTETTDEHGNIEDFEPLAKGARFVVRGTVKKHEYRQAFYSNSDRRNDQWLESQVRNNGVPVPGVWVFDGQGYDTRGEAWAAASAAGWTISPNGEPVNPEGRELSLGWGGDRHPVQCRGLDGERKQEAQTLVTRCKLKAVK